MRRNNVQTTIFLRDRAFAAQVERYSAARRAIARGMAQAEVCSLYKLSATAYQQLAAQAKAGAR